MSFYRRVSLVLALTLPAAIAVVTSPTAGAAPFEIRQPSGPWQTPGDIRQPTGPWQTPGDIQIPKGIQAVRTEDAACVRRVSLVADALFDFDKSTLRSDAVETLAAAGPEIAKAGRHKVTVTGHTDAIGTDTYNDALSTARARTVRDWLSAKGVIPVAAEIKGLGKRKPIAPNTLADGKDNPQGRQQNRRVEIEIDLCDQQARQ